VPVDKVEVTNSEPVPITTVDVPVEYQLIVPDPLAINVAELPAQILRFAEGVVILGIEGGIHVQDCTLVIERLATTGLMNPVVTTTLPELNATVFPVTEYDNFATEYVFIQAISPLKSDFIVPIFASIGEALT